MRKNERDYVRFDHYRFGTGGVVGSSIREKSGIRAFGDREKRHERRAGVKYLRSG